MKTPTIKRSAGDGFTPEHIEKCDFCAGARFLFLRQKDRHNIIACAKCGLASLDYTSEGGMLQNLYSEPILGIWTGNG